MREKKVRYEFYLSLMLLAGSIIIRILIPYQVKEMPITGGLTTRTIPLIAVYILIGLTALYVLQQIIIKKKLIEQSLLLWLKENREIFIKMVFTVLLVLAYLITLTRMSYLPATMIFAGLFSYYLGNRNWYLLAVASLILPVAIYYVFHILLFVPLP